jgi:hypothetical protein
MRSLVCGVVLLGVLTPMVRAQTAQDSRPRLFASVIPLKTGVTVRVAEGGKRGDWQFVRLVADSLTVTSTFGPRRIALGDVDTLWVGRGGSGRAAILGAVFGGAILSGMMLVLATSTCQASDGCRGEFPKAIGYGLAVGGLGGALFGTAVSSLRPQWKRLYP